MGKLVIECLEKKVKLKKLAKAVYVVLGQVDKLKAELVFVESDRIQSLNRDTRGVDKITDVLSYPSLDDVRGKVLYKDEHPLETENGYLFIGSIVMCEDKIRQQAQEYGNSFERERNYLIIHGLLHLFGYDHMTDDDKQEMRQKEKEILKLMGEDEQ